jgi:putative sigma-54 modulation protein
MKVSYKGLNKELPPKLQERLDSKFAKLSKLLETRGEKEAHVVVTSERYLHHAEITLQFYDHQLACQASDSDLYTSIAVALEKMEKQAVKQRSKWREKKRRSDSSKGVAEPAGPAAPPGSEDGRADRVQQVFRANHHEQRKPMTLDEALLEMEGGRDYLVYRDAERERVSVLVRRRDGHFDLIES